MTQFAKAQEPSMEEILASIRRIIADDDAARPAPANAAPASFAPTVPPASPGLHTVPSPSRPETPPSPVLPERAETARPDASSPSQPDDTAEDILDLTEEMTAAPPPAAAPAFRTIDAQPDVVFHEQPAAAAPASTPVPPVVEEMRRPRQAVSDEEALLSRPATAAVDAAFNSLAHTVLVQNARTIDDVVRDMLRPMLKTWLDDNLPGLVERLVRAEIERVSRGR